LRVLTPGKSSLWCRLIGPSTPTTPGTPPSLLRGHQLVGSSQFCMTLMVQPPNSTLIGFQPDSLRACWGVPCQGPLGPANRMAAGSVLWILAMVDGSQQAKVPGVHWGLIKAFCDSRLPCVAIKWYVQTSSLFYGQFYALSVQCPVVQLCFSHLLLDTTTAMPSPIAHSM